MIYELQRKDFGLATHLVADRCNVEAKSVVEGNNPGWVFVDDPGQPTVAFIWSKGIDGFYLIGSEGNEQFNTYLNEFVELVIVPRAKALGYEWFEINGMTDTWDTLIKNVFGNKEEFTHWLQHVYCFPPEELYIKIQPALPNDCQLVFVCDELLNDGSIINLDFLTSTLLHYWDDLESLFQKGFAYCVVRDHAAVSICYSSFVASNVDELGIVTLEQYRRQGFAKAAAAAAVQHSLRHKRRPYWDCTSTNKASIATAESIGFVKAWMYTCYGFPLA
jgi:GNAT superfamily N-acetyltransferase